MQRARAAATASDARMAPFLRMGSWIGGDRDGNPFVNAETLTYALRAQAGVALGHYLKEVHALGAALSLSNRLVTPTPALIDLATASGDVNPHRQDEPCPMSRCHGRRTARCPRMPHRPNSLPTWPSSRSRWRRMAPPSWVPSGSSRCATR
jgi:phosphoenolpyruvate carboxylase